GFLEGSNAVFLNGGNAVLNSGGQQTFLTGNGFSLPSDPLGHGSNSSLSVMAGAHELFEAAHQSVEHTWASNSQDRTLADVDGDGFVDYLVSNGAFSLNHGAGFVAPSGPNWTLPS